MTPERAGELAVRAAGAVVVASVALALAGLTWRLTGWDDGRAAIVTAETLPPRVAGPDPDVVRIVGDLQDADGVADGGQGVAQLVGEHGEELVLAPVVLAEGLLGPTLIVDVGTCAEPSHYLARCFAHGKRPAKKPSVCVSAHLAKSILDFIRRTGRQTSFPNSHRAGIVVWVQIRLPIPALGVRNRIARSRHAGEYVPPLVEVVVISVGRCRPDELRHQLQSRSHLLLSSMPLSRTSLGDSIRSGRWRRCGGCSIVAHAGEPSGRETGFNGTRRPGQSCSRSAVLIPCDAL